MVLTRPKVLYRLVVGMPKEVTADLLSGLSCTSLENHELVVSKEQKCCSGGYETCCDTEVDRSLEAMLSGRCPLRIARYSRGILESGH